MGVFARGNKLWIRFRDVDGEWRNVRSGFDVGQEELARARFEALKKRVAREATPPGPPTTWFTYAISDGDCVKVGRATDVAARRSTLQTGNPRELVVVGVIDGDHEYRVHRMLKQSSQRVRREWFRFDTRTRELLFAVGLLEEAD